MAVSTITLLLVFLIAFKGAGAFAKVNLFIFVGLIISLAAAIGSVWLSRSTTPFTGSTLADLAGPYLPSQPSPPASHGRTPSFPR